LLEDPFSLLLRESVVITSSPERLGHLAIDSPQPTVPDDEFPVRKIQQFGEALNEWPLV
jgi:hypothetical protein